MDYELLNDDDLNIDILFNNVFKLRLPFHHAEQKTINKTIYKYIYINDKIYRVDNKIINNKLEEICNNKNINYYKLKYFINLLEIKYSSHFKI